MSRNKSPSSDAALNAFMSENGIDNKELLSSIIAMLQNFCQDNVLSLQPLLQEDELSEGVQERIYCFATISSLLSGIDKLVKANVTFSVKGEKKKSKKKHKKKRD